VLGWSGPRFSESRMAIAKVDRTERQREGNDNASTFDIKIASTRNTLHRALSSSLVNPRGFIPRSSTRDPAIQRSRDGSTRKAQRCRHAAVVTCSTLASGISRGEGRGGNIFRESVLSHRVHGAHGRRIDNGGRRLRIALHRRSVYNFESGTREEEVAPRRPLPPQRGNKKTRFAHFMHEREVRVSWAPKGRTRTRRGGGEDPLHKRTHSRDTRSVVVTRKWPPRRKQMSKSDHSHGNNLNQIGA